MTSYNSPDASTSGRENSETSFDETGGEITSSPEEEDSAEDPSRLTFETPQTPWERLRRNVSRSIFSLPILSELKALYQLATAVFLTSLGQNCLFFESNMICGSLGKEALAAVGLANSVSVMIISLVPLLCSAYFLNLEPLLLLIGTEPDVAKNILEELEPVVPYLLVLIPLDGYAAHISGVLRGCGLQARGAVSILVSYYGVCTPLYFILGFMLHMGITGLWLALIITLAFLSFIFLIMSNCLNWNAQATKVQAVIGNAIESAIFERTLGRPSEMAPLLRRRLLSQPPQNISVILENSEANVARSIEPTNERSLYSYTTNTNLVMRSSFIPMHGPAPMVLPLPTRVSRSKFKKILLLRLAILAASTTLHLKNLPVCSVKMFVIIGSAP
nr:unnamed protein product [Spirometra erinaceieuropaei]